VEVCIWVVITSHGVIITPYIVMSDFNSNNSQIYLKCNLDVQRRVEKWIIVLAQRKDESNSWQTKHAMFSTRSVINAVFRALYDCLHLVWRVVTMQKCSIIHRIYKKCPSKYARLKWLIIETLFSLIWN
jgi:hypothetical protein